MSIIEIESVQFGSSVTDATKEKRVIMNLNAEVHGYRLVFNTVDGLLSASNLKTGMTKLYPVTNIKEMVPLEVKRTRKVATPSE